MVTGATCHSALRHLNPHPNYTGAIARDFLNS